jgi:hypothetical protein
MPILTRKELGLKIGPSVLISLFPVLGSRFSSRYGEGALVLRVAAREHLHRASWVAARFTQLLIGQSLRLLTGQSTRRMKTFWTMTLWPWRWQGL